MDENAMIPNHTISGKGDSIMAANPPDVVSPEVTMALPIREMVVWIASLGSAPFSLFSLYLV
jgi:hypothetical protein